ncbi:hypothetical protein ACEQPO_00020 [Bacillus sp. SL00103]
MDQNGREILEIATMKLQISFNAYLHKLTIKHQYTLTSERGYIVESKRRRWLYPHH